MTGMWRYMAGAAVLTTLSTTHAYAQEADVDREDRSQVATPQPPADRGDEIIVTARKVEESVQDIPVAITAFSAEDISERSIQQLEDVALLTPGLVFEDYSNGGYGTPVIRGATQFSITNLEQNVSVFLDGVYIPRQYAFDIGSTNLERIEVVKGPQSALYGANAFAGAINYITTNRSLSSLTAHAEVGASEDAGFDIQGKLSLPVIPDVFAVRLSAGHSRFGGDWVNNHPDADADVYPGTTGKTGGYDKTSVMVGATLRPVRPLTLDFDFYNFDTFTEGGAYFRLESSNGDMNCSNNKLFCGPISSTPIPGASKTPGIVKDPRSYGLDADTSVYRVGANLDITDTLSLTYQFGKIVGEVFSAGHADKDPLVGTSSTFQFAPVGNFNYKSHEARLQYQGAGGLYAMLGGFAQDGRDLDIFAFGFLPFRGLTPVTSLPAGVIAQPSQTLTKVRAAFGRLAVPLLDERLTVSAEGRYTDEEKTLTAAGRTFSYTDTYFTPRVGVDYQITPNNLLYASVAKGVKAGGVNNSTFAGLIPEERFYGPDTNWTYEVGSKNSFGGGRGLLNLALFYIDWGNLQLGTTPTGAPINTATIVTNIGGAKSKGAEVEASFEVTEAITLNAGLAYIDAQYVDGTRSARLVRAGSCNGTVCNANGDIGGNALQRSSKWQWNVGAAYDAPITDALNLFGRVDVAGQSKQYTDESNTAFISPRTLVNARLGVKSERWSASVWAKNLFDEVYVSNAFFAATPFATSYVPSLGNRRRIGATFAFDY